MHTRLPGRATRQFFLNTRSSSTISLLFAFQPKKEKPLNKKEKKKKTECKVECCVFEMALRFVYCLFFISVTGTAWKRNDEHLYRALHNMVYNVAYVYQAGSVEIGPYKIV